MKGERGYWSSLVFFWLLCSLAIVVVVQCKRDSCEVRCQELGHYSGHIKESACRCCD